MDFLNLCETQIDLRYATNTSCVALQSLSRQDRDRVVDLIVDYYQNEAGFPFYDIPQPERHKIARQVHEFDTRNLLVNSNELQQVMLGLNLANYYHPQMWSVKCNNSLSPMEIFQDRELFKTAVLKRIQYSDTKLQPFNIRKSLMVFGSQRVSNFRPTVAKYIYDNYCPLGGNVLDPCAGYGGRLLGAWASGNVASYIATDPDSRQINGNTNLWTELNAIKPLSISLLNSPFEDFSSSDDYDLIFTSPPYFNTEKYSYDDTQSWIRYSNYNTWVESFLRPLVSKSYDYLKPDGILALNVGGKIIKDTEEIGNDIFGKPESILYMRLSRVLGSNNPNKFKLEPIYIWRKN